MSEELPEPVAWLSSDCRRAVTATEKKQMLSAGFGSWAEVAAKFTIPLYAGPAQETEPPEQPEQPEPSQVQRPMLAGNGQARTSGMSGKRSALTAARLRELLIYDESTGKFTRNMRKGIAGKGTPVRGLTNRAGYSMLCVDKCSYPAHRLAWLYVHGEWPKQVIDHINGDRLDNRISNLRDVSTKINLQNVRAARSTNKESKLLGAHKNGNKWASHIETDGKLRYLGTFLTPEEAHAAYLVAKRELHAGCTI
jgi:hypothetical protein